MKKVAFYTLGCKVNQYETEAMLELFEKDGYEQVNSEEYADVYVINTCTVTHMSDRKSRQYIRRVKKKNPDAIIAVVGCYSQVSPEEILDIEEVNLVMGTNDRRKIVEEIKKINSSKKVSTVDDIMKVKAFEEIEISQTNGKTRAFMKIQDGCDRFCTYCIIPYARGRVRSRDIDSIVDEVKKLANNGYKEVVLTGIHVASYGKDLKDRDIKLLDVIKQINQIEKIERIRLSSVEPILFTDEFVNEVLKMDKVCPHYHLSLQSGCDETLERMNRRYTTLEYKTIVDRLRSKMPDVAITTDVIVGFPGETNEEFKKTYEFLKEIELSQMHIFKYSPRKGTPAATMENQVDPQMKHFRSEQLLNLSKVNFNKFATKFIDRELDVLFEQNIEGNKYEGLTSNYIRVVVESDKNIQGQILKVKINDVKDEYVEGILL
ncbi:tRNA (N(6)-L-threonylcarbamoyladenosine(37)-C(2))-methylthiotransferase MtaB [Clostridioides difficile]|uniref:tRNA (N(6)-L-threonylcarbamoyladenosine(37)-C(2))- methylthiotransferase MtaB n=1 Tax=Clostridioides difficile TaxID=1496 RepID=UPI000A7D2BFD|nr:tRNA (N(6)-L-threonylcarbamoyladenosine(37)-C(2))-methylthiotransferase MtaB [Clostridioides difficile]EKG0800546.1 tRNA (N(6)-L-threonylcarbamoyladenosine(37)-C(2))-methylthiotransferase MtaB [Clostridioides difficile]EKS6832168.1 tRNA (N(6)-L-threonylcarbamoyladenosine(37)-C(2))-methylthiotransferase MtaB [Clostridioides difficile]MBY1554570.1 tRNA (N(6)-L-threonylcarbamoyladenosine(37)-C(2))-methylthiotransferase MtaB [Clostridioides difficile]MBY2251509.1 tRNA (N(6)-L-threonylcarbamoylad